MSKWRTATARWAFAILSVAFSAGMLAAQPVAEQARPLVKVRINKIPIASYVPIDFALSRGWFKEAGLDVSIETVAAGAVAMQALAGRKLDIIFTALDVGLRAYAQGFDVVILAANNNTPLKPPAGEAILVRKDIGISSLKDLEGKRFLVSSLGNVDWAYSREGISRAGGNPSQVQFLELAFPQMVDAMLGGQADAAAATEPFTTIGSETGKLGVIAYTFVDVQPGLNIAGWVADGGWFKQHREAALGFRSVVQKAIDYLDADPKEKTKAILQFTTLKPDLLSRIILDDWTTKIDADDLKKQLDVYKKQGSIDKMFDVRSIIVP